MAYIPEQHVGIVALTNRSNFKELPTALAMKFFDMYLDKPIKDRSKEALLQSNKEIQKFMSRHLQCNSNSKINLEKYAGSYSNKFYGKVLIKETIIIWL